MSIQFDEAAARLLRRAYRAPGSWVGTYVRNPSPAWIAWGARHRINLLGGDGAPGGQARTRWARAFVRACYYLHRHRGQRGPLQYRVGRVKINPGGVVAGRLVQIRLAAPGGAGEAVAALPGSARIYDDDGSPGGRWADPADRDW